MLKVKYSFTALQPIHTGSDENTGTERKLRREKVLIDSPVEIKSQFTSVANRRKAIVSALQAIWKAIDFDSISNSRMIGIYDEFTSKVLASSAVRTKEQFVNRLCQKLGIRSVKDLSIYENLKQFSDDEFLVCLRDEIQLLIVLMRLDNKLKKENKDNPNLSLFDEEETPPWEAQLDFTKSFEEIPYISGNSIRGYLRRVVMHDFCKLAGIDSLDKSIYHQLFTGGNITEGTGLESIENKENFIHACPMIGLLGSAIGNQTIEGVIKVSGARVKCKELGTGSVSHWELVETKFQTRHDTSKTEKDVKIENDGSRDNKKSSDQMIYQYEVFVVGTKFNATFGLSSDNELLKSAFYRVLKLFKENNYIAGNSARDSGLIDLDLDIPENSDQLYLDHIKNNKESIQEYFKTGDAKILAMGK